jgi:hypothetical protein
MTAVPPAKAIDSSDSVCHLDAEMAELTLLLPAHWLAALEDRAAVHGQSAAQFVRHLIRDHLKRPAP